jgi:hypothetical protein
LAKYIHLLVNGLGLADGWARTSVLVGVVLLRADWLLKEEKMSEVLCAKN